MGYSIMWFSIIARERQLDAAKKDGTDSFGRELNRSGVVCAGSILIDIFAFQSKS